MRRKKAIRHRILAALFCFLCAALSALSYMREKAPYIKEKQDAQRRNMAYLRSAGQEPTAPTDLDVDFAALRSMNPDIVGWIRIPGTQIDYPILKHPSEDAYYLTHSPEKKQSRLGSIYLHHDADKSFMDAHTILFGHNMRSGQMFGELSSYQEETFARAHPDIWIYLPEKTLHASVYSAYVCQQDDLAYTVGYRQDGHNIQDLIRHTAEHSQIHIGRIPSEKDSILTLSTCVSAKKADQRFIVNSFIPNTEKRKETTE